jgi:MFS family permease
MECWKFGGHVNALRKDLRAISADAAAASVMVGIGETYLPAFVLALSASPLASGLTASVPLVVGALLQMAAPCAVRRLGSYRRWVVLCAALQALVFLPLLAAALRGAMSVPLLFAIISLYWATGMAAGATWNTWVGTLVPGRIRARYFAWRTRLSQAGNLLGFIAGGMALQWGSQHGHLSGTFALLFLAATLSRLASACFLGRQSEPAPPGPERAAPDLGRLFWALFEDRTGRLLLYLLGVQMAVQISGLYFTPYMLDRLKLPYAQYVFLIGTAYVSKIVCLPAAGRLAKRWGATRLLWAGGIAVIPMSALWVPSSSIGYLFVVQAFSGAAWAAFELATFLLAFETIPDSARMGVMTAFNLANALAILAGSLVGGTLLWRLGATQQAYFALFLLSALARVFALGLLRPIPGRWLQALRSAPGGLGRATDAASRGGVAGRPPGPVPPPHWKPSPAIVVRASAENRLPQETPHAAIAAIAAGRPRSATLLTGTSSPVP